jgi:hypothetical protein
MTHKSIINFLSDEPTLTTHWDGIIVNYYMAQAGFNCANAFNNNRMRVSENPESPNVAASCSNKIGFTAVEKQWHYSVVFQQNESEFLFMPSGQRSSANPTSFFT